MERVTIVLGRLARRGGDRKDGFLQLFISKRLIQGLATAMMGMFVPIFLYETTGEEFWIVGVFMLQYLLGMLLFLVPGMTITNKYRI